MSAQRNVLPLTPPKPARKSRRGPGRPWLRWLTIGLLAVGVLLLWMAFGPLSAKDGLKVVHVSPRQGALAVGDELAAQGIDVNPRLFAALSRITGVSTRLKAGTFELPAALSTWGLVKLLSRGDVRYTELAVIEGWSFQRMRQAIRQTPGLRQTVAQLPDSELMALLGAPGRHPEGLFYPDTYLFPHNTDDLAVYRMAFERMEVELQRIWSRRHPDVPLKSPYEALILGSIIEKETGMSADRRNISSVFVNRLRRNMPLQTDPTVIYGLGSLFDGDLRKNHLRTDTPYNTYTRQGLPPTPIALPGRESLLAAVQPTVTPYLYFVAKGDGSSFFSSNLDEHNKAVDRYIRGKRKDGTP